MSLALLMDIKNRYRGLFSNLFARHKTLRKGKGTNKEKAEAKKRTYMHIYLNVRSGYNECDGQNLPNSVV